VDPGLSGAVWKIGRGLFSGHRDFKTTSEIALGIKDLCESPPGVDLAVIEAVHAMPGQGVCSMFSFGEAFGAAKAALAISLPKDAPAQAVTPQAWQKFFREILSISRQQEFDSRALAIRLFPNYEKFFSRKLDHNSADACLMAVWGLLRLLP
jgi:hypothetical protein